MTIGFVALVEVLSAVLTGFIHLECHSEFCPTLLNAGEDKTKFVLCRFSTVIYEHVLRQSKKSNRR